MPDSCNKMAKNSIIQANMSNNSWLEKTNQDVEVICKDPCEVQMKVNTILSFLSQNVSVVKRISILIGDWEKVSGCFFVKKIIVCWY